MKGAVCENYGIHLSHEMFDNHRDYLVIVSNDTVCKENKLYEGVISNDKNDSATVELWYKVSFFLQI